MNATIHLACNSGKYTCVRLSDGLHPRPIGCHHLTQREASRHSSQLPSPGSARSERMRRSPSD